MNDVPIRFQTQVRVRYDEADPMGFVHHANYFRYFEYCRTELLRATGGSYKEVEASGVFVVVVKAEVRYRLPARYDDVLTVKLTIPKIRRASIQHEYEIHCDGRLLNEASLTLAVINKDGEIQPIPNWMLDGPQQ